MDNDAIIKADPRTAGRFRSLWRWYRERQPATRIAIPFGLAFACIAGAWTVLNEGEYGVALVLIALFLVFGVQATRETAWSPEAKGGVGIVITLVALYSGAIIVKKKGDKPWTNLTLFDEKEEQPPPQRAPSPALTPAASPLPMATIEASPVNGAKPVTPRVRRPKSKGLSEEEKWILRQLNSNNNAHSNAAQHTRITEEQLKRILSRRLTTRGFKLLIKEVRERGIMFVLTPEIEQELREFAKQHRNTSVDGLIAALNELSFLPKLENLRSEDGVLLTLIKGIEVKRRFEQQMLDILMKKAGYSGPLLMSDLVVTNDLASKDAIRVGTFDFPDSKSQQVNPGSQYVYPNGENISKAYIFSLSDVTVHVSYRVASDQRLPFRDWIRSDEAKQLVTQMTGDVEKMADEGRVMDLTDYDNALKTFRAWIDKCSVALGRIDIQMRRFNRRTDYKFKWDSHDRQIIEIFETRDRKKEILRLELNGAIAELDLVKANIKTETLPDIDSFRRP